MVFELTKENLQNFGFDEESITKLLTWDNYAMFLFNDTCYYATNIEKKIYKDKTAYRKYYFQNDGIHFPLSCPELIDNYFETKKNQYLTKKVELLGNLYEWRFQNIEFINDEINYTNTVIETTTNELNNPIVLNKQLKKDNISILKAYLEILKNKLVEIEKTEPKKDEFQIVRENKNVIKFDFKLCLNQKDEENNPNRYYYIKLINDWYEVLNNDLEKKEHLKDYHRLLRRYNNHLRDLIIKTVLFFKIIDETSEVIEANTKEIRFIKNDIQYTTFDLLENLKEFDKYILEIKHLISDREYKTAIEIKDYYLPQFEETINFIKQLGLFIEKSPLYENYENTRLSIKNAIDIDRIKTLMSETQNNQPKQPEAVKPDEKLFKNEDLTIFKNDLGYTLFNKMFELYKGSKTPLADFSFLFYAMEKEFLVCSQIDFVKFLENEKYNIIISKIDSRQSGKSKKSLLYDSIKESLQKKHEKSTN